MTKEEVEKLWMDNPESMQFLKNATKFYNLMMRKLNSVMRKLN